MTWLQRYRLRHYIDHSIWIPPLIAMVVALQAARLLHWLEVDMGWVSPSHLENVRTVLGALASSAFTFIVFVCSALLVAVQLASGQLTPRIIAVVFRDPKTKFSLAFFVFTFTFTLAVLLQVGPTVPTLTARVAAYLCLASLGFFLYLIDHVGQMLRPSGALRSVAAIGRAVIDEVYRKPFPRDDGELRETSDWRGTASIMTVPNPRDGVLLAIDVGGLTELARRADCVIEVAPQVGDFLAAGDPLFRIHGGEFSLNGGQLLQSIALGTERTMEQDPTFVFRIMVDIASKALSAAINDPTTAVLVIDQIHHLLRLVGSRHLENGTFRDGAGRVRLVIRTPDWEDFVRLAVTEIRQFGGESIQVTRRLRAMLENLLQSLPEVRAPLLRQELNLLHRAALRFVEPEDQALAEVSDFQGVGGRRGGNEKSPSRSKEISTGDSSSEA